MKYTEKQARETIKRLSKHGVFRNESELLEAAVHLACIKRFKRASIGRQLHAEEIYRRLCINRFMPRHDTRELMKRLISRGEWDSLYIVFCWGAYPEHSPCSSTPWETDK